MRPEEQRAEVPAALRAEVVRSLTPVRPLHVGRTLVPGLAILGLVFLAFLWWRFGLRSDHEALGVFWLWGVSALEIVAALLLVILMSREAFPGRSADIITLSAVVGVAGVFHLAGCWASFRGSPTTIPAGQEFQAWLFCFCLELGLGIPMAWVAFVFARRGFVSFPWRVGLLSGLGGGLLGDAIWHLICPYSALVHTLTAHTGGILAVAFAGTLLAALWDRTRLRAWRARRSP